MANGISDGISDAAITAPAIVTEPVAAGSSPRLAPVLLPAVGVSLVAIAITAALGHVLVGVLIAGGVGLGVVNGLLMERATAKITPHSEHEKKDVVKSSLGRLALVTSVALVIAVLTRPEGLALLVALAIYQMLMTLSQLGAAARAARDA